MSWVCQLHRGVMWYSCVERLAREARKGRTLTIALFLACLDHYSEQCRFLLRLLYRQECLRVSHHMHGPNKWATCSTVYLKVEWAVICLLGLCQCVWVFLDWETDQCYLYLLFLICLNNTCINGSSRSQFGNEIYLSLGLRKKRILGEKNIERKNLLLGYSRSGFFPPFPSLSEIPA